jgi:multimeric flavodoxin WrbA
MGKKIIVFCSSPNKNGNTNTVVEWVSQGARQAGAEIDIVDTARLKYKTIGCVACMGCQRSDAYACVIDDEATPVLSRIPQYDVSVFATPVYMMGPTAQTKVFGDRMFSLFKFDAAGTFTHPFKKGSAIGLIATSGAGKSVSGIKMVRKTFQAMAGLTGQEFHSLLVPDAGESGAVRKNENVKAKAIAFGRKIAKAS